jgi:hypothetical protein
MKQAYLTQVPGGVWRRTPAESVTSYDLQRRIKRAFLERKYSAVKRKLRQMGAETFKGLKPTQYKTFYKFLLTLE